MAPLDEPRLLEGVLDNAQIPHCGLVVVADTPTVSGVPILRELLRRTAARNANILLICALHPPSTFLPSPSPSSRIVDLTDTVPGFSSSETWDEVKERILHALKALPTGPVEIIIDAPDILASDYSSPSVLALIRHLLHTTSERKAPSRLLLLAPHDHALLPSLISPSLSPALTLLSPVPLPLLTALSTSYLTPISSSPAFWRILENAQERKLADDMAYRGDEFGVDDWTSLSSPGAGPSMTATAGSMGVSVLVRKATGGAKSISRSIEAVTCTSSAPPDARGMEVKALDELISRDPVRRIPAGAGAPAIGQAGGTQKDGGTHQELGLSFNLSLTDEQRRRRGEVPLPYAHEGEGVELGWEEEEDDDDDEEI